MTNENKAPHLIDKDKVLEWIDASIADCEIRHTPSALYAATCLGILKSKVISSLPLEQVEQGANIKAIQDKIYFSLHSSHETRIREVAAIMKIIAPLLSFPPLPSAEQQGWRQKLFNHMSQEHGLNLLESEMDDIRRICFPPDYPYNAQQTALKQNNMEQATRVETIYNVLCKYDGNDLMSIAEILDREFLPPAPSNEVKAKSAEEILEEFLRPLSESEEDFEDYIKDNKEQIAAIVSAMKEYASRFTLHNPKEEDTARAKAKKWDDLEEKIGKLYDSESSDICEVGEVAATAFGFI